MKRLILFLIFLFVFSISADFLVAEELHLFPDRELTELALIETKPSTGVFSFIDANGEVQQGMLGDLVGIEQLTIIEVVDISITAANYEEYDWYGTTQVRANTIKIPKVRIFDGGKGIR